MTSPASSHGSGDEGDASHKTLAAKDKECQYCHQKFTSSSLGRHLDQFISKKKPDGIHDVDEIRRLRGGITRRTARNSQRKEPDDGQSNQHSPSPQYTLPSYSELLNKTATGRDDVRFNRMNWQATGVITDPVNLNPPTVSIASPSVPSPLVSAATAPATATATAPTPTATAAVAGTKRSFSTFAADAAPSQTTETLRALELSLHEVLDAVRAATQSGAPPDRPCKFDVEAQTFTFLCLALLQAPPTLYQTTPFATASTISLGLPGNDQYQALRKVLAYQVEAWKWDLLSRASRTNTPGSNKNMAEEMENINEEARTYTDKYLNHLDAAYQNFMSFSLEARGNLWTIEMLRAYKTEQDKLKEANARIEQLVQETRQLQQQIDHLSRCQWPREMALWPPDHATFDVNTTDELRRVNLFRPSTNGVTSSPRTGNHEAAHHSTDDSRSGERWDYDRLVNKWKKHVREDRARRTGVPPPIASFAFSHASTGPTPGAAAGGGIMGEIDSPSSTTASTPRIGPGLHKSATLPELPHPSSAPGGHGIGSSVDGSPGRNGSLSVANGVSGSGVRMDVKPPRRLGIVSDHDDQWTPRFMGYRREGVPRT